VGQRLSAWVQATGLLGVVALGIGALTAQSDSIRRNHSIAIDVPVSRVRLLAVGDVNLGRVVGQRILQGDTTFPFLKVKELFSAYDIVFANLESQLSNQGGETQHPKNNLIFTGPPEGAFSLAAGGVHVVSTANNHALDYGLRGLRETRENLTAAGVAFVGTALDSASLYQPVVLTINTITVAFFACTDIMNIENQIWKNYVTNADSVRLFPVIREHRPNVDVIVLSYHGGAEYADIATARTQEFARQALLQGVDLFLGHHPHVPYGIEEIGGRYAVHSLGNFVFRQMERFWTQRSFALAVDFVKDSLGVLMTNMQCIPIAAGLQPEVITDPNERSVILDRIRRLSSTGALEQIVW
jgi:poly-gamma-glutamate capsule biosynthesis protein CapA/YwtB (metallophosphatase superfamily)